MLWYKIVKSSLSNPDPLWMEVHNGNVYISGERDIYLYPNPTSGEAVLCGYMYGYTGIELYDLQGRK